MSLRSDNTYRCDRCDGPLENGSAMECAHVSDMVTNDEGEMIPRTLHFCRVPNTGAPEGCAAHVLSPSRIAAYLNAVG